jgi:CRP-like cAMP-binding protein
VVIAEGDEGAEAYIVARGELEVTRDHGDDEGSDPVVLARLVSGALFGEMALLSRAPRAANVVATRPTILLVAKRDALEAVAEKRPEVGVELAAHCRRRMVANLGRTSGVLIAVPTGRAG